MINILIINLRQLSMSYIQGVLTSDEKVLERAQVSYNAFALDILVGVLFLLMGLMISAADGGFNFAYFIAIFLILRTFIHVKTTEMALTDKRIIHKVGLFARRSKELRLTKTESVYVDQGVLGRLLNFGTVVVVGTGGSPSKFRFIANPLVFSKATNEQLNVTEH